MPTTPAEWFPVLASRLDARRPEIAELRQYSQGDAPMPEMSANTKASWKAFQKKARTDMGGLLCHSLSGRMRPTGVRVGTSSDSAEAAELRRVWRNNRLSVVFADAIWDMLSARVGYLVVGDRDGSPVITAESPEDCITAPDPIQPWRSRAALLTWRDEETQLDFARVWAAGEWATWARPSKTQTGTLRAKVHGTDWSATELSGTYTGELPVFAMENFGGVAEFEPHRDVIDRINLGKLQRLVITAMQAFKARALKNLPEKDEDGNDIDWGKRLEFAPGSIVDLPAEIDIWESAAVDIRPLLEGEKQDGRDFAAVTQTPVSVFIPDGQNQSAAGAENAHKGEIQKAKDRIARASAPMEAALLAAARVARLDIQETVQITWEPPEYVSLTDKAAASVQAKAAGKSQRWIDKNIWGMSPDEIDEEETNRAAEQLQAMTLLGDANAAANG